MLSVVNEVITSPDPSYLILLFNLAVGDTIWFDKDSKTVATIHTNATNYQVAAIFDGRVLIQKHSFVPPKHHRQNYGSLTGSWQELHYIKTRTVLI